jgi:hypothetical protein
MPTPNTGESLQAIGVQLMEGKMDRLIAGRQLIAHAESVLWLQERADKIEAAARILEKRHDAMCADMVNLLSALPGERRIGR